MYTRNSGRNRAAAIFIIIFSGAVMAFAYRGSAGGLAEAGQRLVLSGVAPLQRAVNAVISPFRRISQYTIVIGDLTADNRRLKKENMRLRQEVEDLKKYAGENKRLQRLAGFRQKSAPKAVGALVISRSPTSWQSVVTIDAGAADGVREKAAVVTDKGVVGRTVRVSRSAALVQLLDDRRSGIGVEIVRTGATAIAEGAMDGRLRLRFLPADASVKIGDKLVTSGVGGVYPRGLAIGSVSAIEKTAYSLEKTIAVRPYVDYSALSEVLILKDMPATAEKL